MPYEWTKSAPDAVSGADCHVLRLWPHRSLPRRGFVWFIGTTAALTGLPLAAVLGTSALWGILPFIVLVIWGIWAALNRSYRTGTICEELRLNRACLDVQRRDPDRPGRCWRTNSYWVRAQIRKGPVENYLTLTDGKREIELGAFLSSEERLTLVRELQQCLAEVRRQP